MCISFHCLIWAESEVNTQGTEITDFVSTNVLSSLGLPGILHEHKVPMDLLLPGPP